jgi:hypothetical protein
MDILSRDNIWKIMSFLNPSDVLSLCKSSKRFAEFGRNNDMFKYLSNIHFQEYYQCTKSEGWKNGYLYLSKIISFETYRAVVDKINTAETVCDIWFRRIRNLFDLLYRETGNDHDFGAIRFPGDWISIDRLLGEVYDLDSYFNFYVSDYEIFIEKLRIKDSTLIESFRKHYNIALETQRLEYPNLHNLSFEKYVENIFSLEERLTDYILTNLKIDDIRPWIQHAIEVKIDADIDEYMFFYSDNEKMFLQILHQNICNGKLKLFDQLFYEKLLPKIIGHPK